jgi:ribosomal protein S18 acetylase RimI-like enzyme
MKLQIRPFEHRDADAVVDLSLRTWAPVFASVERVLGSEIFGRLHPDWREDQRRAVEDVLAAKKGRVWVAEVGASVVGFVSVELLDDERSMGEISMLAVDPDYQGGGIGTALTLFALERLKDDGMKVAVVGTGGDPEHAAAHLREGRLCPPAYSQVLQESVARRGRDAPGGDYRPQGRPLFTRVRGRGVLRSSLARSCLVPVL